MNIRCGHCGREFARDEFVVRRRDRRRLATGERVLSVTHRRCRGETEYAEAALGQRLTAAAASRRVTMAATSR